MREKHEHLLISQDAVIEGGPVHILTAYHLLRWNILKIIALFDGVIIFDVLLLFTFSALASSRNHSVNII